MLEVAEIGLFTAEKNNRHTFGLNSNERRLLQVYRQLGEKEQSQIQRLIEQMARSSNGQSA